MNILLISNHKSFQVLCDKTASIYFICKIYIYFSIGNGQPTEPALCLNVWFKTAVETCQLSVLSVWRWCRCAAQPALSGWCSDADGWLWRCSLLHRSASASWVLSRWCSDADGWLWRCSLLHRSASAAWVLSGWCSDADGWLWRCSLLHRSASAACCTQLTCSTLVQWTRATRRLLGCSRRCSHWRCPRRCSHWRCPRRCNTVAVDATFTCHTETDFTFLLKL